MWTGFAILLKNWRLVIGSLTLLACLAGFWKAVNWVDARAKSMEDKFHADFVALQAQTAQREADLNKELTGIRADYARLAQENVKLNEKLKAREVELEKQRLANQQAIAAVQTLPLPELASHWRDLAQLSEQDLRPTPDPQTLEVSTEGARKTVTLLTELPFLRNSVVQLQLDKLDLKNIITNQGDQLAGVQKEVVLEKERGAMHDTLNQAEVKDLNAQIQSAKAGATKGKRNWFVGGLATGAIIVALIL